MGHLATGLLGGGGEMVDCLHRLHPDRLHRPDLEGCSESRVRGLEASLDYLERAGDDGSGGSPNTKIEQDC